MGSLPANEGQARAPRKCNSTNMCSICMRTLAPTQLNQRSSAMLAHLGHGGNWNPKKAHGEASADVPALAHQNCQLLTRSPSGSEDRVGSVLTQKCGLLLSRPTLMAKANSHSPIYPFSPIITLSFSRMSTHVLKRKERMFHVSQLIVSMSPVTHKDRTGRAGHLQPSAHPERPTTHTAPHRLQLLSQLTATVPTLGCSQLVSLPPDPTLFLLFWRQLQRPRSWSEWHEWIEAFLNVL